MFAEPEQRGVGSLGARCLFPAIFSCPATADIRTRCCNIVSVTDNSIRGSLSHCGNEPHHFFLSTHLNIAAMKKKTLLKWACFQHAFICLQLKLCFISINVSNDCCKLGLLYLLVYLIIIIFHEGSISKRPILEIRIQKVSSGFSKSTQQVSFKNLIHHESHHFKEVEEVGELGRRDNQLLCILVIYVCNRIAGTLA